MRLDHYVHLHQVTTIIEFFTHLVIYEDPDRHQGLNSSFIYHPVSLHKISSQSVHNIVSNAA